MKMIGGTYHRGNWVSATVETATGEERSYPVLTTFWYDGIEHVVIGPVPRGTYETESPFRVVEVESLADMD